MSRRLWNDSIGGDATILPKTTLNNTIYEDSDSHTLRNPSLSYKLPGVVRPVDGLCTKPCTLCVPVPTVIVPPLMLPAIHSSSCLCCAMPFWLQNFSPSSQTLLSLLGKTGFLVVGLGVLRHPPLALALRFSFPMESWSDADKGDDEFRLSSSSLRSTFANTKLLLLWVVVVAFDRLGQCMSHGTAAPAESDAKRRLSSREPSRRYRLSVRLRFATSASIAGLKMSLFILRNAMTFFRTLFGG